MPAEEKEVLAQLLPVIQTALVVPSNVGRYPIFDGSYDWHSCVHAHWYEGDLPMVVLNHL